jgi:hypothetical protein
MAEHKHHNGHHHGHSHSHGHGDQDHTHGVIDPSIITTERGIWAVNWGIPMMILPVHSHL